MPGLGLGMSMWSTPAVASSGGGGAFTPASLPGLLVWVEADPTKLYTDSGSTLVSADGQLVAQINPKGGSLTFNDEGGGSTVRPSYKTGSGHPYLQFDGVNNVLQTTSTSAIGDANGQWWISASLVFDTNTGTQSPVGSSDVNNRTAQFIRNNAGIAESIAFNSSYGVAGSDSGGAITAGTRCTITVKVTTTTIEVFVNGASGGASAVSGTLIATSSNTFYLGMLVGGSQKFGGRLYGLVEGTGTLSSSDQASLETYLAAL